MNIYTTLQLGAFHPIFCEDFLFETTLDARWHLAAVFDGCSSGKDSHFAATLLGKVLKMIVKKLPYQSYQNPAFDLATIDIHSLGDFILQALFKDTKQIYNQLLLNRDELMATMLLALYDKEQQSIWLTNSGDGVFVINDNMTVIEQGDCPNYMGYHLDKSVNNWINDEVQCNCFEGVTNWAIASDGVLSFAKNSTEDTSLDVPKYLLIDTAFANTTSMLHKKCVYLKRDFQLLPNDDVAIVRGILA